MTVERNPQLEDISALANVAVTPNKPVLTMQQNPALCCPNYDFFAPTDVLSKGWQLGSFACRDCATFVALSPDQVHDASCPALLTVLARHVRTDPCIRHRPPSRCSSRLLRVIVCAKQAPLAGGVVQRLTINSNGRISARTVDVVYMHSSGNASLQPTPRLWLVLLLDPFVCALLGDGGGDLPGINTTARFSRDAAQPRTRFVGVVPARSALADLFVRGARGGVPLLIRAAAACSPTPNAPGTAQLAVSIHGRPAEV